MIYEVGNRHDPIARMYIVGEDEAEALRRAKIIFGRSGYIVRVVQPNEEDMDDE